MNFVTVEFVCKFGDQCKYAHVDNPDKLPNDEMKKINSWLKKTPTMEKKKQQESAPGSS